MKLSRSSVLILGAWVFFVGGYTAGALLLPRGSALTTFSDLFECLVPLFANTCLLWNAASPYRRRNAFWMLLAMGSSLWLAGQLVWTYMEIGLHRSTHSPFPGDLLFFLHTVPLMAALALAPHARKMRETLRYGFIDLVLLAFLWLYVYVFVAMPWSLVYPNAELFRSHDLDAYVAENLVVVIGFGVLFLRTRGSWRVVYAHLFGAASLYLSGFLTAHWAISSGQKYAGSLYALPFIASFVWWGTAGIIAHGISPEQHPPRHAVAGSLRNGRGTFHHSAGRVVDFSEHGPRFSQKFSLAGDARDSVYRLVAHISSPASCVSGAHRLGARALGLTGKRQASSDAFRSIGKACFARPAGRRRRT
jgi:hypothetical protein